MKSSLARFLLGFNCCAACCMVPKVNLNLKFIILYYTCQQSYVNKNM